MTVDSQMGIPLGEPKDPFKRFRLQRRPVRPEVAVLMVILVVATVTLWISNIRLERRLKGESARVQGLSDLVEQVEQGRITRRDFEAARAELEGVISDTEARVRSLEAAAGARERVIDEASRSVVFVQGSYGFIDRATSLPLRYFVGQGRQPIRMPDNMQLVTIDGDGPFVRSFYTGTAFVATRAGLLITNRHMVRAWEYDPDAQFALQAGFAPDPQRLAICRASKNPSTSRSSRRATTPTWRSSAPPRRSRCRSRWGLPKRRPTAATKLWSWATRPASRHYWRGPIRRSPTGC